MSGRFAHFFVVMSKGVEWNQVRRLIEEVVESQGYELVEAELKGAGNNAVLRIFIDKPTGITHHDCELVSEQVGTVLDVEELIPYSYTLEVSSPGLDEPLKLLRQYKKNVGRQVELVLNDGSKKEGRLLEVTEDGVIVEEIKGKNKKREVINHTFLFDNIKTTKIQVVF